MAGLPPRLRRIFSVAPALLPPPPRRRHRPLVPKTMTRAEIEKTIEPIIRNCLRELSDYTKNEISDEVFDFHTQGMFRPDVRRVSLIISLAQSLLGAGA